MLQCKSYGQRQIFAKWWHIITKPRKVQYTYVPNCTLKLTDYSADIPRPRAPSAADGHGWTAVYGKLQPLWFSGPLIPTCIALIDDRLPSDDDVDDDDNDGEKSDSEGDLAFDEYTVSKSESDDE